MLAIQQYIVVNSDDEDENEDEYAFASTNTDIKHYRRNTADDDNETDSDDESVTGNAASTYVPIAQQQSNAFSNHMLDSVRELDHPLLLPASAGTATQTPTAMSPASSTEDEETEDEIEIRNNAHAGETRPEPDASTLGSSQENHDVLEEDFLIANIGSSTNIGTKSDEAHSSIQQTIGGLNDFQVIIELIHADPGAKPHSSSLTTAKRACHRDMLSFSHGGPESVYHAKEDVKNVLCLQTLDSADIQVQSLPSAAGTVTNPSSPITAHCPESTSHERILLRASAPSRSPSYARASYPPIRAILSTLIFTPMLTVYDVESSCITRTRFVPARIPRVKNTLNRAEIQQRIDEIDEELADNDTKMQETTDDNVLDDCTGLMDLLQAEMDDLLDEIEKRKKQGKLQRQKEREQWLVYARGIKHEQEDEAEGDEEEEGSGAEHQEEQKEDQASCSTSDVSGSEAEEDDHPPCDIVMTDIDPEQKMDVDASSSSDVVTTSNFAYYRNHLQQMEEYYLIKQEKFEEITEELMKQKRFVDIDRPPSITSRGFNRNSDDATLPSAPRVSTNSAGKSPALPQVISRRSLLAFPQSSLALLRSPPPATSDQYAQPKRKSNEQESRVSLASTRPSAPPFALPGSPLVPDNKENQSCCINAMKQSLASPPIADLPHIRNEAKLPNHQQAQEQDKLKQPTHYKVLSQSSTLPAAKRVRIHSPTMVNDSNANKPHLSTPSKHEIDIDLTLSD